MRELVDRRSGGYCEAAVNGNCRRKGGHHHHKLMRSQGGQHTVDNLIDVCENCHRYIHEHPDWSYKQGFLIRGGGV